MLTYLMKDRAGSYGFVAVVAVLALLSPAFARADQSITLRSGNGPAQTSSDPAPRDAQVRFYAYGSPGYYTPTAEDFQAAQTGTPAYIDKAYSTYVQQLPSDPLAQWIGTTPNLGQGSALYAIPFMVNDPVVAAATLDLGYAVDNGINGIYINGKPISNNIQDGDYHGEYYVLRSDIAPLLIPNAVNWLYVNAYDGGVYAGLIYSANISIQGAAPGAPTITPALGGNTGNVTVRIIGSGFQADSQISLTGSGSDIQATDVTVVSPNIVTGTFNLNGAAAGARTVKVSSPSTGSSLALPSAFTVESGGTSTTRITTINTPSVLGRIEFFYITVFNDGTVDSGPTAVTAALEPWSLLLEALPAPTTIEPLIFPANPYPAILSWDIPNIPPGGAVILTYSVTQDPKFPVGDTVTTTACTAYQLNVILGYCSGQLQANLLLEDTKCSGFPSIGDSCVKPVNKDFTTFAKCMNQQGAKCGGSSSNVRGSIDPNDLTGPSGYGAQGWFQPGTNFQYVLSYNNEPTATNPATNVYLTDIFDPAVFDLSTLAISGITLPSGAYAPANIPLSTQPFTHDIDLRPAQDLIVRVSGALDSATNKVSVSLLSLDPATGLEPADPTVGFLAPGAGGSVLFTVNPKQAFPTGTVLQDAGSVIFDTNDPIDTPVWTNTVDITPPVSHVNALPATESGASFPVSWTGTDVGSGIADYTIYVSDNGGPFLAWLIDTSSTSAMYPSVAGHSYAFYSIADDFAGNTEGAKTAGEASTTTASLSQTIRFSLPPNARYGIPMTDLAPFAKASSGLPVQFSIVSGPAVLNGTIGTPTGVGAVTIQASQAGDGSYFAATPVTQTIQILPGVLQVKPANAYMVYGSAVPTVTAFTVTGFVYGDLPPVATGTPAITAGATSASPAGNYPITASVGTLAAANYSFVFEPSVLTVAKARLVAAAANLTMAQGSAVPALTYSLSGFVNSDTAAAVTGAPVLTTTATPNSPPGTYPITISAGSLGAANYVFQTVNGTLTVTAP